VIEWPNIVIVINLFTVSYRICIMYKDWLFMLEVGPSCGSFTKQLSAFLLKKTLGVD
jgi:hypothetical protein